MSTTNNFVFIALHIVAWIIFVGLCIEAGAIIVNLIFSLYNPEFVHRLYEKLDLTELYIQNQYAFYGMYIFLINIALMKAQLFYRLIMLLSKLDLLKPFNRSNAERITNISYQTFAIGIVSYVAQEVAKRLPAEGYKVDTLAKFWTDAEAFILMSAIVYVIAIIFTRGVEIQAENDLTV